MSSVHIIFVCLIPFTDTMNSTKWPAPNVWVFIAQLVEHCSANAEAMGSNPVEAPKAFFQFKCSYLNRNHNWDDHTFISLDNTLQKIYDRCPRALRREGEINSGPKKNNLHLAFMKVLLLLR